MCVVQIAKTCGASSPHLYKVLRVLAHHEMLDELPGKRFTPNDATRELVQVSVQDIQAQLLPKGCTAKLDVMCKVLLCCPPHAHALTPAAHLLLGFVFQWQTRPSPLQRSPEHYHLSTPNLLHPAWLTIVLTAAAAAAAGHRDAQPRPHGPPPCQRA